MKVALYARVSTYDQQTLPMQLSALRDYTQRRGWTVTLLAPVLSVQFFPFRGVTPGGPASRTEKCPS
jgi:hypothetical protein